MSRPLKTPCPQHGCPNDVQWSSGPAGGYPKVGYTQPKVARGACNIRTALTPTICCGHTTYNGGDFVRGGGGTIIAHVGGGGWGAAQRHRVAHATRRAFVCTLPSWRQDVQTTIVAARQPPRARVLRAATALGVIIVLFPCAHSRNGDSVCRGHALPRLRVVAGADLA